MLVSLLMGFSSGLPLLLTLSLLQAWMKEEGVDLGVIGLVTLVGLPYTLKFLWAPLLDRYSLPFLGRRRGWLLVSQLALVAAISGLGLSDPGNISLLALAAVLVAFLQREPGHRDRRLSTGSPLRRGARPGSVSLCQRLPRGMLLASGGGLILADHMSFQMVYQLMAACMVVGVVTTLLAPEPDMPAGRPRRLAEAVWYPFVDYFRKRDALWILLFILLYKIGDTMASAMTTPFYLDIGYTKTEIGAVAKLLGFWAILAGGTIGGVVMLRLGINRSLWVFGALQAVSTAGFAVLAGLGHSIVALGAVIGFENLSGGMGTAAFVAFMASLTNKRFTATQYALLTSLMGVPRVILSAPTGYLAQWLGWGTFFGLCALVAIPG